MTVHDHHLQTVFDIGTAHIRIIIQRQQLDIREHLLELLADATADHMVRQAAERL